MVDMPKVYREDEIIQQLSIRPYYESFFAKIKITNLELSGLFFRYCDGKLIGRFPDNQYDWDHSDNGKWLIPKVKEGDECIVSIHNMYHQQLLNPKILQFHFNCTTRTMLCLWDLSQGYLGLPAKYYGKEVEWDENGVPI